MAEMGFVSRAFRNGLLWILRGGRGSSGIPDLGTECLPVGLRRAGETQKLGASGGEADGVRTRAEHLLEQMFACVFLLPRETINCQCCPLMIMGLFTEWV